MQQSDSQPRIRVFASFLKILLLYTGHYYLNVASKSFGDLKRLGMGAMNGERLDLDGVEVRDGCIRN
jgi:hypothetical protein